MQFLFEAPILSWPPWGCKVENPCCCRGRRSSSFTTTDTMACDRMVCRLSSGLGCVCTYLPESSWGYSCVLRSSARASWTTRSGGCSPPPLSPRATYASKTRGERPRVGYLKDVIATNHLHDTLYHTQIPPSEPRQQPHWSQHHHSDPGLRPPHPHHGHHPQPQPQRRERGSQ